MATPAPMIPVTPEATRQRHSGYTTVLALAGLVLLFLGLKEARDVIGLTFLAGCLVITAEPIRRMLINKGLPRWLATTALILSLYAVILFFFASLALALTQLVDVLPQYEVKFGEYYHQVLDMLARNGISNAEVEQQAAKVLTAENAIAWVRAALGGVGGILSALLLLIFLMAFMAADTGDTRSRTATVMAHRPELARALGRFAKATRKQWAVGAALGLLVAVLDYGALLLLGVPMALTWALLAFITNFIPNIGFFLGLIPPALMALLEGGWTTSLWVIVLYTVINNGIQDTIQPKMLGDAVGLNTTTTFVSLLLWAWVLGPLGAVLSIPLTLFFKAVLVDADPSAHWINTYLESPGATRDSAGHARRTRRTSPARTTWTPAPRRRAADAGSGPAGRRPVAGPRRECDGGHMTDDKKITVSRTIPASADAIFDVLSNPKRHQELDGSGFIRSDERTNRIQAVGDVFTMNMDGEHMDGEYQTDNHVTGFSQNQLIAWQTAPAGTQPPGWEWVWELEGEGPDSTVVTHTYDWSKVTDKELLAKNLFPLVSEEQLEDSLNRLAEAVVQN